MADVEQRFNAAVDVIRSLPKNGPYQPSHELMLKFYGLFKQAKGGRCTLAKPGFWDVVNKAKWNAWSSLGDMSSEAAMQNYVDELKKIVEAMPQMEQAEEFVHVLGPFYELAYSEEDDVPAVLEPLKHKRKNKERNEVRYASNVNEPLQTNGLSNGDLKTWNASCTLEAEQEAVLHDHSLILKEYEQENVNEDVFVKTETHQQNKEVDTQNIPSRYQEKLDEKLPGHQDHQEQEEKEINKSLPTGWNSEEHNRTCNSFIEEQEPLSEDDEDEFCDTVDQIIFEQHT